MQETALYQEVNNLIYRIRIQFTYFIFPDENKEKDCNRLIELLPSEPQKNIVILFRDNKLSSHLTDLMTPSCLLDAKICYLGIKSNAFESCKDDPNLSYVEKEKYKLSNNEMAILSSELHNREAIGYVNGRRMKGAMFELIEYSKLISEILGIEIPFKHDRYLDNLIFNYFEVYRGWRVESFAKYFLSDKITMIRANDEKEEIEFNIEKKRAYFAQYFYDTPSKEKRKNQPIYFDNLATNKKEDEKPIKGTGFVRIIDRIFSSKK